MSEPKAKVPVKGGLTTARQKLKELRIKKLPSPELIKIIDEVTHNNSDEKTTEDKKPSKKHDIAARPKKRSHDLDL